MLDGLGQRLDGTDNAPVQNAVTAFTKSLPFNGRCELVSLVDMLQTVDGVDAPYINQASASYGALPFGGFIDNVYVPDSGYLRIYSPGNLTVTWEASA